MRATWLTAAATNSSVRSRCAAPPPLDRCAASGFCRQHFGAEREQRGQEVNWRTKCFPAATKRSSSGSSLMATSASAAKGRWSTLTKMCRGRLPGEAGAASGELEHLGDGRDTKAGPDPRQGRRQGEMSGGDEFMPATRQLPLHVSLRVVDPRGHAAPQAADPVRVHF